MLVMLTGDSKGKASCDISDCSVEHSRASGSNLPDIGYYDELQRIAWRLNDNLGNVMIKKGSGIAIYVPEG